MRNPADWLPTRDAKLRRARAALTEHRNRTAREAIETHQIKDFARQQETERQLEEDLQRAARNAA